MVKQGKKYRNAIEEVGQTFYSPDDAIALAKKVSNRNFDEAVELHILTSADPKHADQQVRGFAELPHGTGKQVRVLVFAEGDVANDAKEAGADIIADQDVIKKIETGWSEFDVSIATPDQMSKIGRLGRYLGRKGLMPNPKTGTVVESKNLASAVSDNKHGRVEIKLDKGANIHARIGNISFDEDQILENLRSVYSRLLNSKPENIKGQYIKTASMCTTMGPSVKLNLTEMEKFSNYQSL